MDDFSGDMDRKSFACLEIDAVQTGQTNNPMSRGQLKFRDNHTRSTLGSAFDSGEATVCAHECSSDLGRIGYSAFQGG